MVPREAHPIHPAGLLIWAGRGACGRENLRRRVRPFILNGYLTVGAPGLCTHPSAIGPDPGIANRHGRGGRMVDLGDPGEM